MCSSGLKLTESTVSSRVSHMVFESTHHQHDGAGWAGLCVRTTPLFILPLHHVLLRTSGRGRPCGVLTFPLSW